MIQAITIARCSFVFVTTLALAPTPALALEEPSTPQSAAREASTAQPAVDMAEIDGWRAWAESHQQKAWLIGNDRLLCIGASDAALPERDRANVERALARCDEILGAAQPADRLAVFALVQDRAVYQRLLERIVEINPHTSAFARSLEGAPKDFVLEDPVCGVFAPFAQVSEEWNAENEVVHRVARMRVAQRFGHQPHWVAVGLAWQLELDALGSIYCFPDRDEFVTVGEHGGFAPELAAQFKKRAKSPVKIDEIDAFRRGAFDAAAAARAWGTIRYLVAHEPEALPKVLADLGAAWEQESRETRPDGSWVRRPAFELSPASQAAILEKHCKPRLWERLTEAFRDGKTLRVTTDGRSGNLKRPPQRTTRR